VDVTPDRQYCEEHYPPGYKADYYLPLPPRVREDPRFELVVGNSISVDLPPLVDLVMIDSSHEYLQTVAELMRAALLEPAVIALHDYYYVHAPGVKRAVDEFATEGRYSIETIHPSQWGLAVLRR
jgi:hypothetical protein